MVKCPECKKEISNPEFEFHIGQEENGTSFGTQYARVPVVRFFYVLCRYNARIGRRELTTDTLEFHIACSQCIYSNMATASIPKYKEVVYQPLNENGGKQNHNMKDQIRCDSCHNSFDFYWCEGHTIKENDTNLEIQNNGS